MLPDFLKRENWKEPSEKILRFSEAIKRYEQHFKEGLSTEGWGINPDEFVKVIDECIATNQTIWEYFGTEYDPEDDY